MKLNRFILLVLVVIVGLSVNSSIPELWLLLPVIPMCFSVIIISRSSQFSKVLGISILGLMLASVTAEHWLMMIYSILSIVAVGVYPITKISSVFALVLAIIFSLAELASAGIFSSVIVVSLIIQTFSLWALTLLLGPTREEFA